MLRIAFTPEYLRSDEALRISAILDAGWDFVHLRAPKSPSSEIRKMIDEIDPDKYDRIVIHDYFDELGDLGIGGVHLNGRNSLPPDGWTGRISRSCHSLDDIIAAVGDDYDYAYLTISPVFESRSKRGYTSSVDLLRLMAELPDSLRCYPIVALGGIIPASVRLLTQSGFDGYAVLGYLAEAPETNDLLKRIQLFSDKK